MATNSRLLKLRGSLAAILSVCALLLGACAQSNVDEYDQVTWYAVNSEGALQIIIYDLVCDRRMGRVRISGRRETAVTTCADENGRAQFRFRPDSYATRSEGWSNRENIRPNQRVYIQ